MGSILLVLFSSVLFLFLAASSGLPLCTNSRAPISTKVPLAFCAYNGSTCCSTVDDASLQKQFASMDISDTACGSLVKSVICAKCDPFSSGIFPDESKIRTVPLLCNSTFPVSSQSKGATTNFCEKVWNTCKDVSIRNSPFAPSLLGSAGVQPSSPSRLTDLWQSKDDFCQALGGSSGDESVCFNGNPVSSNTTQNPPSPKGLCLERIWNESYLNMVPHPDGSSRVFLSNQQGKIWLAKVPQQGSGGILEVDISSPFLDLTDEVHSDSEFGLMGLAFHPGFTTNGRLFVSYNCDKVQSASCAGRCSCNSDVNCDPSKLTHDNGDQPCRYQSVIAEYSVNGTSSTPSTATTASPSEVRRIFTMGLPFTSHHGGQILFGPADGYLYFMMGDGGGKGDPLNFSQNKKSLLGKIMRLDVNNMSSGRQISDLGLWGNYSIPKDNPYVDDSELQPEIWALGLRNPWRCSFDSEKPSYFFCADVGQDMYEEVDLISKGGNYGWRVYEGPLLFSPASSPGGNVTLSSLNAIFPVMGYPHSAINTNTGSASITGGYVYRATADPCMVGRYLYTDLYASAVWEGTESPANSGNYNVTSIPFSCANDTPIPCESVAKSSVPFLGFIFSFGEDNSRDVFLLTSKGVYRVVRPSRCGYTCSKESTSPAGSFTPKPPSSSSQPEELKGKLVLFCSFFLLVLGLSI